MLNAETSNMHSVIMESSVCMENLDVDNTSKERMIKRRRRGQVVNRITVNLIVYIHFLMRHLELFVDN
jgi:hypothetical protein